MKPDASKSDLSALDDYLAQSYRRDVLGTQSEVRAPERSEDLIREVRARIAKIDALRLGASLASRDYVSYQNRRALVRLLTQLEMREGPPNAA